jgi:predicted permease
MVLNEEPHLVIGVLGPSDFQYPQPGAELYLPLRIYPGTMMVNRGAMWVGAVARLRPGTLLASARAQLASVAGVLERRNPGDAGLSATILPLREAVGGSVGGMMALLSLAVGAVLAIACLNIANLLLGLSQARSRELAVRAALGGSAFRVRRQLLTESLVLAAVGGGIALALAPALTRALLAAYPGSLPRAAEVGMSPRVIMAGVTVSLAMALFVSLPLLRRTGRGNVPGRLRSGWREGRSAAERRFGDLLVASQVAVSLAVVAAAVLMVRTVVRLSSIDPGYDPRGAISFRLYASAVRFPGSSGAARFYDQVLAGIRTIPGVRGATTITQVPFSGSFGDVFVREDVGDQGQANPHTQIVGVSAGFERVLGLPLRAGRSFEVIDGADSSAPVVVIDETLARRAFRGTDPVGKLIAWQGRQHWRVVGVVGLSRSDALYDEPPPHLYFSTKQIPRRGLYVVVRTSPRPQTLLPELRAIVRSVDPEVAITNVETFDDALGHSIAPHRFRAWLTGVMAAVAFLLAILGIYAVVAYGVARQARETGIRMALGEDQASVRRRVVVMALRVAAAGVLAGLAISLVSARWLGAFLVGVSPYSAGTLAAVAAAMLAVTGLAAAIPAARASRTDPAVALRAD